MVLQSRQRIFDEELEVLSRRIFVVGPTRGEVGKERILSLAKYEQVRQRKKRRKLHSIFESGTLQQAPK